MAQDELVEYVNDRMERRGWSLRELAQRAGLPHSTLHRMYDPQANLGPRACNGLARALGVPAVTIFEMAGLLPKRPPDSRDTELLRKIYYDLDENARQELVRYAEFLRDRRGR